MKKSLLNYLSVLVFLLLIIFVHGCKTSEVYRQPDIVTDSLYRDEEIKDSSNIGFISWEKVFTDTVLKSLIRTGLSNNLDLKIAIKRIEETESILKQKGADFDPSLDFSAKGSLSYLSENAADQPSDNKPVANYRVGFLSSWEADLWGKLSSAERSAYADLLKSEAVKRSVQTRLVSDIAKEYYFLLLYHSQEKIILQTIKNREEDLETVKLMKTAAILTEADVKQSEAQVYSAQVLLPKLRKLINISENAINMFLGRAPQPVYAGDLDDSPQPVFDTAIGYPSQLLINRPDILSSEQSLIAAFENTNVARANFYPSFRITANLGIESFNFSNLFVFPGSIFANILGDLVQPIFNKRKNQTELEVALARQQVAAYTFKKDFLTAVQEVSNSMVNYRLSGEIIDLYFKEQSALEAALEYSHELLLSGFADYIEVLRVEDLLLNSRLEYTRARLEQLNTGVDLYRSLGGGWR